MSGEMAKNKAYSNNEKLSKKQFVSTYGSLIGLILDMLGVNAYYQMLVKGFVVIGAVMLDGLSSD